MPFCHFRSHNGAGASAYPWAGEELFERHNISGSFGGIMHVSLGVRDCDLSDAIEANQLQNLIDVPLEDAVVHNICPQ